MFMVNKKRALRLFQFVFALLLCTLSSMPNAWAQGGRDRSPHSEGTLISEHGSIRPGTPFTVALRLQMEPHWHTYWVNPGDSGLPTTMNWKLPSGFKAGPIQWPFPQRIVTPPLVSYAYEDEVWLLTTITPPATLPAGKNIELKAHVEWLICKESCVPAEADLSLAVPVSDAEPAANSQWADAFKRTRAALPVQPEGLSLAAESAAKTVTLRVQPASGSDISLDGAQFFSSETAVLDYNKPQKATQTGEEQRLALTLSEYATGAPKRLRGILLVPEGRGWNAAGARALAVDVPIGAPSAAMPPASSMPPGSTPGNVPAGNTPPTLLLALGLAFVGGLMLNLMPCVFPVSTLR